MFFFKRKDKDREKVIEMKEEWKERRKKEKDNKNKIDCKVYGELGNIVVGFEEERWGWFSFRK